MTEDIFELKKYLFEALQRSTSELRELVMHREAWRAAIHGVAKSRTRLRDWTELNWTELKTSLVAQWIRIRLPMQETKVPPLLQEDSTCWGITKPMLHNFWGHVLEPRNCSDCTRVPQLRKPARLEPVLGSKRSHCMKSPRPQERVDPTHHSWRKPACSNKEPGQPK